MNHRNFLNLLISLLVLSTPFSSEQARIQRTFHEELSRNSFSNALNQVENMKRLRGTENVARKMELDLYVKKGQFYEKNNPFLAEEAYKKALGIQMSSKLIVHTASLMLKEKKYHSVVLFLKKYENRMGDRGKVFCALSIANAYVKMEKYDDAIFELKKLLRFNPKNPNALQSLTLCYLKNRQAEEARETLKQLSQIRPLSDFEKDLLKQANSSAKLSANQREAISSLFELRIDRDLPRETLYAILSELEQAYSYLGKVFHYYPEGKTRVNLLYAKDYVNYHEFFKHTSGVHSRTSNEIFIKLGKEALENDKTLLMNTLWHEYNHHLVAKMSGGMGRIPSWFAEGLATYLQPHQDEEKWQKILFEDFIAGKLLPEKAIFRQLRSYREYVHATSLVAMMDQKGDLQNIISGIPNLGPGYSFKQLFEEVTGVSQLQMRKIWINSLKVAFKDKTQP